MLSSVYLLYLVLPYRAAVISNLFIKFYLDTSISRYIFIVKIFLEILLTFSPRPAALPVVQAVPVILRTDPRRGI
jgi:hypothetical protein